jgi:hypothetical protein
MTKNKPVVVKAMAKKWGATKKWNKTYFIDNVGQTTCMMHTMNNFGSASDDNWSMYRSHAYSQPTTYAMAITKIESN